MSNIPEASPAIIELSKRIEYKKIETMKEYNEKNEILSTVFYDEFERSINSCKPFLVRNFREKWQELNRLYKISLTRNKQT